MNIKELRSTSKIVLVWKMGSDATQDIIALVPITGPIERWMDSGFDFLIMPNTINWLAPRFVSADGAGFTFEPFSALDPKDIGFTNVCIQQIMSVTPVIEDEVRKQYLALIPEELKQQKIL